MSLPPAGKGPAPLWITTQLLDRIACRIGVAPRALVSGKMPGSAMNVKLQALLNAGHWIEAKYGRATLDRVLASCSPEVRQRFEGGIVIEWLPLSTLTEFYEAVVRVAADGDREILRECGAHSARKNFKRLPTRLATWVFSPEAVLKRVAGLWRQYNDHGEIRLLELSPGRCKMEVRGIPNPHWGMCTSLCGWAEELAHAVGWKNPLVKHPECRARGDRRCVIEVRYTR